jgi:hypothetical protein
VSRNNDIVYEENEQGEFEIVDYEKRLADRNEEIKGKLAEAHTKLKAEKKVCRAMHSKEKFGGRFAVQLDRVLRSYGYLTAEEFINLDYQQIQCNYNAFLDLIAYYNLDFEIAPNKQMFCSFMGINIRQYAQLESHNDTDIRDLMASINDSIISLTFVIVENGNGDGKSGYNRLTLHGAGHGLVKESEKQALDNGKILMSETERRQQINSLFGGSKPKKLTDK